MEDPDTEWEIQEYSPSYKGEVTKVRWIFNKGLWLGKKVVITGVVISSAPFVLPPLVVFSALGFAFSVPFGLVFASYACTDKVMSKLLPAPESSMLEYYTYEDMEEGTDFLGKFVMEGEEEELEETKGGVDMRFNLDEDDGTWQKDVESWEEQPTVYSHENMEEEVYEEDFGESMNENIGENIEEDVDYGEDMEVREQGEEQLEEIPIGLNKNLEVEGYKEDVGECMEGEDDSMEGAEREIEVREEGDRQELIGERRSNDVPSAEIRKVVILVPGNEDNNDNARELEELDLVAREIKGIKDEYNVGDDVVWKSREAKGIHGLDDKEDEKTAAFKKPIGDPLKEDDVLLKKLKEEAKETGDRERAVEETPVPLEGGDVELEKPSETIDNVAVGNQLRNPYAKVDQVDKSPEKCVGNLDKKEDEKPEVQENIPVQEETTADINSVNQFGDMTLKKKKKKKRKNKKNVVSSNAGMSDIADESGFDLVDATNAPSDLNSYPAFQAESDFSESTAEVNVDFLGLPTAVKVFDSRNMKNEYEKDEFPSSQVLLKEIWEQIDGMRTIVGYKATPQQTCIEELEALYMFTGIEPPPSFKDPSDLADINSKLRFLMSIVGVKR